MCGFVAILNICDGMSAKMREKALLMSSKIRHRGPDWSGVYSSKRCVLAHERLAIVDPLSGGQPLYTKDKKVALAVNGEIYNHQQIRERLKGKYEFQTGSDCEVILALYREKGINFIEDLNGIFAFCLYDEENDTFLIARDHIGIIPLYIGYDYDGTVYVASELKALEGFCEKYEPFLPGYYYYSKEGKMRRWWHRDWFNYDAVKNNKADVTELGDALKAAVKRQLMSDVPYGVLLSGGLDSSVISAVANKYSAKRVETDDQEHAWWPRLHSFAVGIKGSPDLAKARIMADHLGTVHHEVNYTVQEG
ncbi:MAG: asparagine synthase (glutamine-hydrolyzing), partial [Bacteroidales bacterium]|nr:asparagine synthase (glutamine-hydrolyzing) [Bacteroidales bacterium]